MSSAGQRQNPDGQNGIGHLLGLFSMLAQRISIIQEDFSLKNGLSYSINGE